MPDPIVATREIWLEYGSNADVMELILSLAIGLLVLILLFTRLKVLRGTSF